MWRIDVTRRQYVTQRGRCKDILSAVEFARSADTAAEKNVPTPTTFLANRLPTLYGVALERLTENVPRKTDVLNARVQPLFLRNHNFNFNDSNLEKFRSILLKA